jgi:methylase of polypeptide subunit release factors
VERIAGRAAPVADVDGFARSRWRSLESAPRADLGDGHERLSGLARANVCRHGLGDRVSVVHGDLLDGSPPCLDLVVANLPYLAAGLRTERPELAEEPPEAVFAAGDGLGPYRRLVQACQSGFNPTASWRSAVSRGRSSVRTCRSSAPLRWLRDALDEALSRYAASRVSGNEITKKIAKMKR